MQENIVWSRQRYPRSRAGTKKDNNAVDLVMNELFKRCDKNMMKVNGFMWCMQKAMAHANNKEVKDRVKDHKRKHDSDDDEDDDDDEGPSAGSNQGDEQSSKKPHDFDASASKQHLTLTLTGWQITDTRDVIIDSSMHSSEPESGHSEHSSDDVSKQDEGHVSDLEDTDNAHIPK
ncbi:hypothetical protein Tco_0899546, partial [Tanacetum coccineum]